MESRLMNLWSSIVLDLKLLAASARYISILAHICSHQHLEGFTGSGESNVCTVGRVGVCHYLLRARICEGSQHGVYKKQDIAGKPDVWPTGQFLYLNIDNTDIIADTKQVPDMDMMAGEG